jgi:hypothetical protein
VQSGLKFGLLAAAGMSAWTLCEYGLGLHTTRLGIGYYSSWGTVVILVLALWRLLRHELHGTARTWLPVWEGLLYGVLASLVAAMGFYVFISVYLHFLNPDYADLRLEWQVARMRQAGNPEEAVRAMARGFRWSTSPVGLPVTLFITYGVAALIASPVLTLWLNWRRKEPADRG